MATATTASKEETTMRSNNPVFSRSQEFQPGGANIYGNQTYAGNGSPSVGYGQPGYPQGPVSGPTYAPTSSGPMTIDSVVQKTGISLAVVIVTAVATWALTGDITATTVPPALIAALTIGSLAAFALSIANSFKRVVSPALVLAFCAAEGVALGAFSKYIDSIYSTPQSGDLVIQAVVGTFAAFAGTLAAYKFFDIKVGTKFRTFVTAAVFGMIGLSLLEVVLGIFGSSFGLFGFGALGLVFAVAGLVLGVFHADPRLRLRGAGHRQPDPRPRSRGALPSP